MSELVRKTNTRYGDMYYYANDQFIGASLEYYGEYTNLEIDYVKQFINEDDVIIDIGANIGTHTLAYSSLVPNGMVISYEPNQKNYNLLVKNIETNNITNVHAFLGGLGYKVACSTVTDFDPSIKGNYGVIHTDQGEQVCFINKLDNLVQFNKPVKFVKIDVEGKEADILMGGFNFITHHKPIIQYECMSKYVADNCGVIFTHYFPKYKLYWMPIYNYNQHNIRNNSTNIFLNSGVLNILAVHSAYKQPENLRPFTSWDDNIIDRSEGLRLSKTEMLGG